MKKTTILLSALFIFFTRPAFAQENVARFGANGGFTVLTSSENLSDKVGFGVYIDGEYLINQFGIGAEIGVTILDIGFSLTGTYYSFETIIPILLKPRYYFTSTRVQPYASFGMGVNFFIPALSTSSDAIRTQSNFTVKPEIGVRIKWINLGVGYYINGKYNVPYQNIPVSYNTLEFSLGFNIYVKRK